MQKPTKRQYCDNIEYRDILTHVNRHQLFLISPIPKSKYGMQYRSKTELPLT